MVAGMSQYRALDRLTRTYPSHGRFARSQTALLSSAIFTEWDRIEVLGGDESGSYSHSGCVNALSWGKDGQTLISGGDDTRIHIWRLRQGNTPARSFSLDCDTVISTGHKGNIFNAQQLPYSSCVVSVAADRQVRVLDINRAEGRGTINTAPNGSTFTRLERNEACISVLRCHRGRVKRITTEESPFTFLTVSEDGTVRQHDLREYSKHSCSWDNCPQPLVKLPHELSTLALSQLAPYTFVVGGESPYAHLFDRRQNGRVLQSEWGMPSDETALVSCVRRFGRYSRGPYEPRGNEHITGARMSQYNGHEIKYHAAPPMCVASSFSKNSNQLLPLWLAAYSSDAVYMYNIRDPAEEPVVRRPSVLPSNHRITSRIELPLQQTPDTEMECMNSDVNDEDSALHGDPGAPGSLANIPVCLPRQSYHGACNRRTVKDVNFLGPQDELVVSGSDDGNFFVWSKDDGNIQGIYEGDSAVVNVIEGHPYLPLVAVSGIDHTIKVFSPVQGDRESAHSLLGDERAIVERNIQALRRPTPGQIQYRQLLAQYRSALQEAGFDADDRGDCVFQ